LNFTKRRRAVPLQPIWTVMVAAKLDHSRILVTNFHHNRSTLKGRSAGQRQTDRQAGWFLRPDCAPRSECPQIRMPAERRAQLRVSNVPRSRISERAPFRIYEHAQCRVFERTSLQRAHSIGRGCRVHTCAMAIGADFKMYLLRQFCSNRVDFFTIHRRHRRKKMMEQNFEIRIMLFLRIF